MRSATPASTQACRAIAVYSSLTSQHSSRPPGARPRAMQIDEYPVNVPDLDRLAGADEAGEQRHQGALVGADLHPGRAAERARAVVQVRSTSSGGAVRAAM